MFSSCSSVYHDRPGVLASLRQTARRRDQNGTQISFTIKISMRGNNHYTVRFPLIVCFASPFTAWHTLDCAQQRFETIRDVPTMESERSILTYDPPIPVRTLFGNTRLRPVIDIDDAEALGVAKC